MSPVTPDHPKSAAPARPVRSGGRGARRRRAPLAVAAAVAALWSALVCYLPVAVVSGLTRFSGEAASVSDAARLGLATWLLGHGVPLSTEAGPVALAPLAVTAFAAWRVSRAGVHVTRAIGARRSGSPRQALTAGVAVGIGYGVIGLLAAVALSGFGPAADPARAGGTTAVFGAVAALFGAGSATGTSAVLASRIPPVLFAGLRTGTVATLLLLGAGAGAAGLAVATGGGEASEMIGAYRTGVAGQAGITLVSLAYAPNAAVWSVSYLLGPGFSIGTGTVVRVTEVTLGGLPAVPLLTGLPAGPLGAAGALLLAVPVLAGAGAGGLLTWRLSLSTDAGGNPLRWGPLLGSAVLAGPVGAVLLGLAAAASDGALGGGRLVQVGPVAWQVAVVASGVLALGAVIGAALTRLFVAARPGRVHRRPGTRPDRRTGRRTGHRPGPPGDRFRR